MKKLISRRSFLQGTGIVAAAAALTACGGSKDNASSAAGAGTGTGDTGSVDYSTILAEFDKPAAALQDWGNQFDTMIDQIRTETDLVKREAVMHEAEDLLMGTWCLMPVYFNTDVYLQKDYITNVYNNVFGLKRFYYAKNANNNNASINMTMGSEPDLLDPSRNTAIDGGCLDCNMFLGLMNNDAAGKIIPGCAAEQPQISEDGTVYTFTLREGLKWSDGEKLDANDFVYSWNRAAAPETQSDYLYLYDIVAKNDDGSLKVEASADGLTLTVTLIAPCPYFLDLCAFPTFFPVPQKYIEAHSNGSDPSEWTQEAGFVTNGAYTCSAWSHGESITLTANPNFVFASDVTIPELNFMLSSDNSAIYAAYSSGDLDFTTMVPTDEMATLKQGTELHIDPYLGTYYVCCNVNSEVFNAGRTMQQACALRKALCLAIDRDYIVSAVTQGGEVPANCFVSDGVADGHGGLFRENDDAYTYPVAEENGYFSLDVAANADEVVSLLGAAGLALDDAGMVSSETPFSFEYLVDPGTHVSIAEALQQDFASLGIDMTLNTQEFKVFLNTRKVGNYDIARNGWVMDYNDPINELEMWTTKSGNNDVQFGK